MYGHIIKNRIIQLQGDQRDDAYTHLTKMGFTDIIVHGY